MIQSQKFHLYRNRHLFNDDDCIGKYDAKTPELVIHPDFKEYKDKARAFLNRATGRQIPVRLAGEEPPKQVALKKFPAKVIKLMSNLGDLTPALIIHARKRFTKKEFEQRYSGRVSWEHAAEMVKIEEGDSEIEESGSTPIPPPVTLIDPSEVVYSEEEDSPKKEVTEIA